MLNNYQGYIRCLRLQNAQIFTILNEPDNKQIIF
jgi:hypothetical protein